MEAASARRLSGLLVGGIWARGLSGVAQLLLVPAELVRPQGSPMLKLPQSFPHQDAFWETLRQINRLAL